ncbi:hypothetical protein SJI00_04575 [Pseudomonas sp. RP23018S]|uniref:hypothetical protein n=1 Tax=Pseudomonas sp. RP23018S TaxID=3096037 RepID=UPI002ACAC091|nr:hypothetical protein [Pseudomonas sp. RP23018S]MDZ5602056.1 hypothetical protein [Pseudomonas sp. RP23018S]
MTRPAWREACRCVDAAVLATASARLQPLIEPTDSQAAVAVRLPGLPLTLKGPVV